MVNNYDNDGGDENCSKFTKAFTITTVTIISNRITVVQEERHF